MAERERLPEGSAQRADGAGARYLEVPHGYPASPVRPELRMATIHKNVKVIYRVDVDRILVITVLDTRAANAGW